ncbi:sensor histidine kinase [Streptomyces sp. PTM05]|uniref:Sensor histidine kinase n=1 Tax=Streptantibioticus parmotrematis TaxID=2873249 RepID=A0ABS7QN07_9ACTN|nr:sensor histidine kinase [Streptantibioticus parmotrematis]MBY8884146.1 sensor histidine kinase [Streptantibioticus parmotrematis]
MGGDDRVGGGTVTEPEVRDIGMGMAPETRRQQIVKLCWTLVYLLYMAYAVADLVSGDHTVWATVLGWLGLAAFLTPYLYLVLSRRPRGQHLAVWQWAALGWLYVLAVTLSLTLGQAWLMLFVYVTITSGVLLPFRLAARAVVAVSMSLLGAGLLLHANGWLLTGLVLPSLLGGGAMMGVSQMGRTMRELRAARETVAHLAANEERLRLARDLHDLLGHSLSLITLKSELAGRMLPDKPEEAARQVADIERVSRQALVDVREAVSGFRRPTLAVELAGVRTALHTAGVEAEIAPALQQPVTTAHPGLGAEQEGALAWALREAVTNVVRHSGASACELSLDEVWEADETRYLRLEIADDGRGPARGHHAGNGLSGLEERLVLSGGRLETGPSRRGGFAVRAYVPLRAVQDRPITEPSRPQC